MRLRFIIVFLVTFFYLGSPWHHGAKALPASPEYGDILINAIGGEPTNLLPFMTTDLPSSTVSSQFFIAPLRYNKDLEIELWAAESYEVLDGGLRLRFTLKKGIQWSDGYELTTDDVEFTYKLMIDPATPTAYAGDYTVIESFIKLDRYTFEVTYNKPYARSLTTWMLGIMPKHALEGQDLRTTNLARNPVSCGPFLMKSWQPGIQILLEANPNYFKGKPFISQMIYRVMPDSTTTFLELKAGKIDSMSSLTPYQYVYLAKKGDFFSKFAVHRWLGSAYTFMGFNLKSPLFADTRVRKALAYAIDKDDIIKGALFGQGVPITAPYKPGSWAYNTDLQDYLYSPDKALSLFSEAGWVRDDDGILKKNGVPFHFTLLVDQGNETRVRVAIIIQQHLRKVGINTTVRTVEWASFINQFVMKGFFDAVILGWSIPLDPDNYQVWHSSGIGALNFISYSNSEVDNLLEEARSTFDQKKRKKLYDKFQQILHEEQPYSFLFVSYALSAIDKRFHGVKEAPAGIFYNLNEWWVPLQEQRYRLSQ